MMNDKQQEIKDLLDRRTIPFHSQQAYRSDVKSSSPSKFDITMLYFFKHKHEEYADLMAVSILPN